MVPPLNYHVNTLILGGEGEEDYEGDLVEDEEGDEGDEVSTTQYIEDLIATQDIEEGDEGDEGGDELELSFGVEHQKR